MYTLSETFFHVLLSPPYIQQHMKMGKILFVINMKNSFPFLLDFLSAPLFTKSFVVLFWFGLIGLFFFGGGVIFFFVFFLLKSMYLPINIFNTVKVSKKLQVF